MGALANSFSGQAGTVVQIGTLNGAVGLGQVRRGLLAHGSIVGLGAVSPGAPQ